MSPVFSGPIWEGRYPDFESVPVEGDGFTGQKWADATRAAAESLAAEGFGDSVSLLPLVTSICPSRAEVVRILDFGGGPGATFAAVKSAVKRRNIEYHVVENRNVCEIGRKAHSHSSELTFHDTLPVGLGPVDVVHFGSSIQYVDDWRGLLQKVVAYEPTTLLFTELMAGDIPTFASAQNYYGSRIPMWFLNFNEFNEFLRELGFHLAFRAPFRGRYLGVEQPCPQENFPADHRIGYASHALFVK